MFGILRNNRYGDTKRPKKYHYWLRHLYLKIGVTIVARWTIAAFSSSTLFTRHIRVEHTLNARLTSRCAFIHAMKTLGERYSYGINKIISRFRDVRYRFRWLTGIHVRFWTCWWFPTRSSLVRTTRLGVTVPYFYPHNDYWFDDHFSNCMIPAI